MELDSSNHICLICNQTIVGLINYVEHYKSHVPLQENRHINNAVTGQKQTDIWQIKNDKPGLGGKAPLDHRQQTNQSVKYSETCSGDTSPLSEFIDNTDDFTDPDLDTDGLMTPKHCSDFFQSLELKSATDEPPPPRPKIKAVQKLSILEDDSHAESLLPITSILSNLDFSSDEEFLPISDNEGQTSPTNSEGFWLINDSQADTSHPPQGHTGGKWNPGEGPKRRLPIAGKWKPGCGPGPACRKNILRKPVKLVNNKRKNRGKPFRCNVCNADFSERKAYSLHFGQQEHINKVEAIKQQMNTASDQVEAIKQQMNTASDQVEEAEMCRQQKITSHPLNTSPSAELASIKPKNVHDACFCSTCDLYFDNASVFSVHCDTKLHKEKVEALSLKRTPVKDTSYAKTHDDSWSTDSKKSLVSPEHPHNPAQEISQEAETHSCNICQKIFNRKYEMARHLLTRMHRARAREHPEALSVEMLNRYNKYMIRLSLYQCGMCQYYCNRQADFLDHMGSGNHVATCQDMLGPIMCVACKFKTHKHDQMMEHLQYPEHLQAVAKKHGICIVRESHSRITCKFCGVKMHSAVRMLRHCQHKHKDRLNECQMLMYVVPPKYIVHECPLCKRPFRTKSALQLHFLKVHRNISLYNCTECNRSYLDEQKLEAHLQTRYHAKRVITNKFKDSHVSKILPMKKSAVKDKDKKKNDEKEKSAEETKTAVAKNESDSSQNRPVSTDEQPPPQPALRRSNRKRKKLEFYNVEEDEDIEVEKRKSKKALAGGKRSSKSQSSLSEMSKAKMTKRAEQEKAQRVPTTATDVNNTTENDTVRPSARKMEQGRLRSGDGSNHLEGPASETDTKKPLQPLDSTPVGDCEPVVDEETLNQFSKKVFSCVYCEYAAVELTELREHYYEIHPHDILTCQPCNQYYLSLKAYKIHCSGGSHQLKLKEHHGETKSHKCPVCEKRFLQESCCLLHLETVHRHPSSEADLQKISKGQDLVTQLYGDHVVQVLSLSSDTSVSCPECGKFVRKDTLVEHLRLHTGERPYICRFCSKGFTGRLCLRRHISSHLNMPMFMCDTCGKEFKRNAHLIQHIRQHDLEKKGEKHTCNICPAEFFTPEELTRHMKRHGERNFKCTWPGCPWTFVLSGELKSHMFTHTGEKKYLCDICGYGAPTKTRLRRHEKIHEKSRNFNCEYCLYKASCKTHLKRHMRIHINTRPFACPYCSYTCNTHENIRKHILKTQKHKGMKLYPCKLCSAFSSDSGRDFKAHLMTVHKDYLRDNAIDSLSVFAGLYKREEDYQKPKEGSVIVQVTKGRFFRSYQNPDAPIQPSKPKKIKKSIKQEVKVRIVPPSELEDMDKLSHKVEMENIGKQELHPFNDEKPLLPKIVQSTQIQEQLMMQNNEDDESQNEVEQEDDSSSTGPDSPQYISVSNMVIPSFNQPETQQLSAVSFTSSQQLPVTVSISDEKLFWTVVPEQKVIVPAGTTQTSEPWYSGMPQVHAPTSQELQQYRQIEVTTSHPGTFLPSTFYCNIPVGDIQTIQGTVGGGPIYTGIMENLVVINDPVRSESASL